MCQTDPELKEDWGCEKPAPQAVWEFEEEELEFYSCPILWVSEAVVEWYSEYCYCLEFGAVRYAEQSTRFLEAMSVYKYYMSVFKNRKPVQPEKTEESFANLRNGFMQRG